MRSTPLNFKTAAGVVLIGLFATWWIRHAADLQSRLNADTFKNQQRQIAESTSVQASPANPIAQPPDLSQELEQLRTEKEKLRTEISNLQSALRQPPRWGRSSLTRYPTHTNSPEEIAQTAAIVAGKKQDVEALGHALNRYVADHQGQFPAGIGQLDSALQQGNLSLTGTNQFDIVYTGTADELTNFPLRSVAMIRERQPWLAPDGQWTRVYGMYGGRTDTYVGSSRIVSADDGFSAFEGEFVVAPPAPTPDGQ